MPVPSFTPSHAAGNFFSGVDWTDPDSVSKAAGAGANQLNQQGKGLFDFGSKALQPVLSQLMKLLSGDDATINEAIRPQARGVIDQYDTARKAISQFTPRGGGQETALATSRFREAGKIADLKSDAITSATTELGNLGAALMSSGAQEQQASLATLMGLIQSAQQSKESTMAMWGQIGLHAGKLIAAYYTGGASVAAIGV
jgi:hypothetical protein